MELFDTFLYSNKLLEIAKEYVVQYQSKILLVLLAISVLNCFFGYHLRKLWGILAGMLIGALLSAVACIYIAKTGTILYIAVTLGAFTLGLLALLLYRVGLFFIGTLTVPLILSRIFPVKSMDTLFVWIVLGLLVSTLTLFWERESVSTITAIGGGFGTAKCLVLMQSHQSFMVLLMLGIALSLAGILLQFQPWRSRSAWNSDESRARDKHRHKRRMKRIRKKKKYQEKLAQRKAGNKATPESVQKRQTTEYIPYSTRPLRQTYTNPELYPNQGQRPNPGQYPPPEQHPDSGQPVADPNLSDIRQMISREVSDIYAEKQQSMDAMLDELLEQEYRNTTKELNKKR